MPLTALDDRTALVTIDLQNAMVGMPTAPNAAADVVANAARLAEAFRAAGLPVIHVRASYAPDFGDAFQPRAQSPLPHINPTPGWDELTEGLGAAPTDVTVTKHQFGGFTGTDLDQQLRRRGVTGVVFAGIATSLGVESTARSAMDHSYNVTIAEDAVSDLNPAAHASSLENIFPLFAEIDSTAAIIDKLGASA